MDTKKLHLYKDRIKKLHKATLKFKEEHDEFNKFHKEQLYTDDFDTRGDWVIVDKFFKDNPELKVMLDEVESIIKIVSK